MARRIRMSMAAAAIGLSMIFAMSPITTTTMATLAHIRIRMSIHIVNIHMRRPTAIVPRSIWRRAFSPRTTRSP